MKNHFFALAAASLAFAGVAPMGRQTSDPETNPGPIANYDRAAIRAAAAAERKAKHDAKMARRAARK